MDLVSKQAPRVGVLIQGQLFSYGRTSFRDGPKANLRGFQAADQVLHTANKISRTHPLVVATWSSEPKHLQEQLQANLNHPILFLDTQKARELHNNSNTNRALNTFFQFYAVLRGAQFLAQQGCTHILKLRTDQDIDVAHLLNQVALQIPSCVPRFWTPYFDTRHPWSLADFYFAADCAVIESVAEFMLSDRVRDASVHSALFSALSVTFGLPHTGSSFRKRSNPTSFVEPTWNFISVFGQEVWRGLIWRGEQHADPSDSFRLFGEQLGPDGRSTAAHFKSFYPPRKKEIMRLVTLQRRRQRVGFFNSRGA